MLSFRKLSEREMATVLVAEPTKTSSVPTLYLDGIQAPDVTRKMRLPSVQGAIYISPSGRLSSLDSLQKRWEKAIMKPSKQELPKRPLLESGTGKINWKS